LAEQAEGWMSEETQLPSDWYQTQAADLVSSKSVNTTGRHNS